MKCVDHPNRDAVALLDNRIGKVIFKFGVCDECFKEWKKTMNRIYG